MPEYQTDAGVVHVHFDGYQPPPPLSGEDLQRTSYVIDGDTILVGGQRWRLYGIDAPPVGGAAHCPAEQAIGLQAKAELERLIALGHQMGTLRFDLLNLHEKYLRHMVRISVNGVDVAEILKTKSLARDYTGKAPKMPFCGCPEAWEKYRAELQYNDEKRARHLTPRKRV